MGSLRALHFVTVYQLAMVAALTLGSLWLWPAAALAVLVGGAFGTLNFWALRLLVQRTLEGGERKRKVVYAILLGSKLVVALAVMAGLMLVLRIDPLGFALGLSSMFLAVAAAVGHVALVKTPQT